MQWHPEFHAPDDPSFIDDTPILDDFLAARGAATRPRPSPSDYGTPMKIINPATGAVIAEVAADSAAAVRAKYEARARGAAALGAACR